MKLSIITINYNNREGLSRTIDSIIRQTCKEFEWIIIDGDSTDGSRELIRQNEQHISYWISEPDKGIYNAMNKGLQQAHGEYCLFLNSGDWLAKNNSLDEVLPLLSGDIFIARSLYYNGRKVNGKSRQLSQNTFSASTIARESLPHQSTFIKTSLLRNAGGYDETYRLLADWAFFLQSALSGTTEFVFTDICTTIYDTRGLSATNKTLFEEEKKRIMAIIPAIYRKDIPLALSLQDVQASKFGCICYRILYRMTTLFKRHTK
jgi:glycosyltransferase involved in cell wall biosynthesis